MKKIKKLFSWILTVIMLLSLVTVLPITVSAEESYDAEINVVDGIGTGSGWTFASGEIWINENGSYLIYGGGTEAGNRIRVKTGVTASVILDNVNIYVNLPFEVGGTSNVTMILKDDSVNTFRSYGGHAGVRVQSSATLTITTAGQSLGNGSLSAYGDADSSSHWASAGIGGSELEPSGTIVIDGGTIFAKGGDGRPPGAWRGPGAAGIGGASTRSCGDITINGGTVTAFGGGVNPEGAGIGGGSSDPSLYAGKIAINGGTVRAYSGQAGESGTGIGFCASIAIADTADVKAYSSGNYPAIYGTAAESGHSAYLQNFVLDTRVLSDTDVTITQLDDDTETFEMTLLTNYKNFAATLETDNDYNATLSDGSKKIVSLSDGSADFPGICDLPGTELSSVNVKLKAESVCMIGAAEYETLGAALANISDGETIQLLKNLNHSSSIVADNQVLSIDLNGFDLIVENAAGHALEAKNNGVLSILDEDGDGVLTVNSSGEYKHCVNAVAGGKVNIKGNLTASIPGGAPSYQNVIGAYADGAGSTINLIGNATGYMAGVYSQNGAVINVTGSVSGGYYGAFSAYNGSVNVTGDISGSRALVSEYGGMATVEGDITGSSYAIETANGPGWAAPTVTVTGDVTGTNGTAINAGEAGNIEITGAVNGSVGASGGVSFSSASFPVITINGDIKVSTGSGIYMSNGGTVTVNGRILDASPYMKLDNKDIAQGDYNETLENYYKYFNQTAPILSEPPLPPFAPNTVYVKKPSNQAPVITSDWSYTTVYFDHHYPYTITVTDADNTTGTKLYSSLDDSEFTLTLTYSEAPGTQEMTLSPLKGVLTPASHTLRYYAEDTDGAISETLTLTFTVMDKPEDTGGSNRPSTPPDTGTNITVSTTDGTASVAGTLTQVSGGTQVVIKNDKFGKLDAADRPASVDAQIATVTFDEKAMDVIGAAAGTGDVTLTVRRIAASELSQEDRVLVGSRPVYGFTIKGGGAAISGFGGGYATVGIPYTLSVGENPHAVVIWYLSSNGELKILRGHYDAASGTATFITPHFSSFVIGYNLVSFNDVALTAWYHDAVTFLAAREITIGTPKGNFSPNAALTRGQFIVMLMRAYGIEPDVNPTDNFLDAGGTYYTGYLAAAKRLGISSGVGGNLYAPEKEITRQEMFTLLYNALNIIDGLPSGNSDKSLSDYADEAQIAPFAREAMKTLVETGIVSGSADRLHPLDSTTRAEMAQVLYSLLSK